MGARHFYSHADGYQCELAATGAGWAMIAAGLPAVDERFVANMDAADREWESYKAIPRAGVSVAEWIDAYAAARERVWLIASDGQRVRVVHEAEAEAVSGLAVAGGDRPAWAWTCRVGDAWRMELFEEGRAVVVATSPDPLLSPSLARDDRGDLLCAWSAWRAGGQTVCAALRPADGCHVVEGPAGRMPSVVGLAAGFAVFAERAEGATSHVGLNVVQGGRFGPSVRLSGRHAVNMAPRAVRDGDRVHVVWCSAPAWRLHQRVDQMRWIELRTVDPATGVVADGPGTDGGLLPIATRAAPRPKTGMLMNVTPSNPRIAADGVGNLACTVRVYDPDHPEDAVRNPGGGMALPLWITALLRWDGRAWSAPRVVSASGGHPETAYGLACAADGPIVGEPVLDTMGRHPPRMHRIEVHAADGALPPLPPLHASGAVADAMPVLPSNPITHAPELPDAPEGLTLVYGDLHEHSSLSSCYAMNDGPPTDNLRWRGDALGDRVLTFTEHIRMSDADFSYHLDLLEQSAPAHVPIYATEWAKSYIHNIIFYSYDKEVMKRLRVMLLAELDFTRICEWIVAETPPGSVAVVRHYHGSGRRGDGGPHDTTMGFFPELEWSMEVASGRGDCLADQEWMLGRPIDLYFPVNFIHERGARIGFCGGSDHAGNSPCSTGFWVREVSGPGVFEALRARRTIACCRGKVALWARVAGQPMGSVVEAGGPVTIEAQIASPVPIATVSLWRDDRWLEHRGVTGDRIDVRFTDAPGPGEHHYVVRAQSIAGDLPVGPLVAYSSPTYVRSGSGGNGGT